MTPAKQRMAMGPATHPSCATLQESASTPAPITPVMMCAMHVHKFPVRAARPSSSSSGVAAAVRSKGWLPRCDGDIVGARQTEFSRCECDSLGLCAERHDRAAGLSMRTNTSIRAVKRIFVLD